MLSKLSVVTVAALVAPPALAAQDFLDQFSYEGLGLAGLGIDVGRVASDRLTSEWSLGVRVDYGMIAPRVRVMLGASYFKGELASDQIAEFESSLGGVVRDPTGDAVIDIGRITWANLAATVDLQYMFTASERFTSYVGVGFGIHLRNGAGEAIDDTFVEDALDTVAAGASGTLGIEVALTNFIHVMTEIRGGLSSELLLASVRGGVLYRLPGGGS